MRFPRLILVSLVLLSFFKLYAQQPSLKVAGKDSASVSLTKLKTSVKVIGNYAITTMEMEFCNKAPKILEGELVFPMPEGVSISRYAIDINGKMREAVPVEKEKGQVVFENIERRKVDPGLLEKVQGNNFRTRIYPIPANGCRRLIVGYEQLLPVKDFYSFIYSLPLHYKTPIKEFDFFITVATNYIPEVGSDCNTNLKFEELNKAFTASVIKNNFTPDGTFNIIIPKTPDAAEVSMQSVNGRYYFLINSFPAIKKTEKKIPGQISVIWDASLSGSKRDHVKELELLDAYIKTKRNVLINLYQVDIGFKKINSYLISNGNWNEMKKILEETTYDGATNFSIIPNSLPGEEFLIFTDGLNSFGNIDELLLPKKPVYSICAATTADYKLLTYISSSTGGAFINLNELDIPSAKKYLTEPPLQFLGIKSNPGITGVYPSIPTSVINNLTIAGISNSDNAVLILQFGYGNSVAFEQPVAMNAMVHKTSFVNIEKLWAQKKIDELEIRYENNKEQVSALGKKYSIVTPNTSLIVLDRVEDYVQYDIEPPVELRGEYNRLIKEKRSSVIVKQKDAIVGALRYFTELTEWWKKDFKPAYIVKEKKETTIQSPVNTTSENNEFAAVPFLNISDSIRSISVPLQVPVYDSLGNVSTYFVSPPSGPDRDGDGVQDTYDRCPEVAGLARYQGCPIPDTDKDGVNDEEDKCLNERGLASNFGCPIIEEAIVRKMNLDLGEATNPPAVAYRMNSALTNRTDGLSISNSGNVRNKTVSPTTGIVIKEFIPEQPYLKELDRIAGNERYKKYLELRRENELPSFYFNVANLYFKAGDTLTGYKILSNIADLNLDDHESYKMLGYRLKTIKKYDDELIVFRKVLQWRPQEPQSYRDYALALEDVGKYQNALDTLYLALTKNYDEQIKDLYPGIEEIIVTEINELIARHGDNLNTAKIDRRLINNTAVDVRVVLNWNMVNTDIDLWVFDPNEEKCYYSHKLTKIGGRISYDFTRGYGPEQFMLKKALKGNYKVMINFFGETQTKIAGPTTVMAEIFTDYGRPTQKRKMITLQMEKIINGEVLVGEFSF